MLTVRSQRRLALRVEGTTKDVEQILTDHLKPRIETGDLNHYPTTIAEGPQE